MARPGVAISVIIAALNEEKYIRSVVDGLKSQTFKDFEVIVVDGGSHDRTKQIAREIGTVIIERRKGIALARNRGARAAKGKILFFTNADTKPCPTLLETYHNEFNSDSGMVAATGPLKPLEKSDTIMHMGYKFVSVFLAKFAMAVGQPSISGSNFAVRSAAFRKLHGFNERYETYEDLDLSIRLKKLGEVRYINEAMVKTSTRRIEAWGIPKYVAFNFRNIVKYNLSKSPARNYEPIR
ncbi:MAG: glycosyltransferase [Candidatus Micrarchaeota archaeon]|nr:glycosyltransferase [Candidatus Micrarchaeota archaeon]